MYPAIGKTLGVTKFAIMISVAPDLKVNDINRIPTTTVGKARSAIVCIINPLKSARGQKIQASE